MNRPDLARRGCRRLAAVLAAGALLFGWGKGADAQSPELDDPLGARWPADLAAWRRAKGNEKFGLGETLARSARDAGRPDLIEAVAAGGERRLREGEIRLPRRGTRRVRLTVLRNCPELRTTGQSGENDPAETGDWLARRITRDAFEVWSPRHGWLFDGRGRLLNEARPPRRDGVGRQWFGAFLPDGRWVTTDLWEWDRTLTFFSREGQWLREIPGDVLLPRTAEELAKPDWKGTGDFLITWARSDRDGRNWIVQVGTEGGRDRVQVGADGSFQALRDADDRGWRRCYPRQLGPRGNVNRMTVPDDSGCYRVFRWEPAHGPGVGYPQYFLGASEDEPPSVRLVNGEWNFGFWPGTTDWFVLASHCRLPRPGEHPDDSRLDLAEPATWFFDRHANFQGWVRAARLADAADGRAMLFLTADHRIVTLDRRRRVRGVRRFTLADGKTAVPLTLFADLCLGFFRDGKHVVLARWKP